MKHGVHDGNVRRKRTRCQRKSMSVKKTRERKKRKGKKRYS
jgi:hypothetical protein